MTRLLACSLAIAACTLLWIRSTAADTYETVDAVEVLGGTGGLRLTGVISGQVTPSTVFYQLGNDEKVSTCVRLAVLAMSKPGKFQLAVTEGSTGSGTTCKLAVRTP